MQLNVHCCFGHEFVQSEQDLCSLCRESSSMDLLLRSSSLWKMSCWKILLIRNVLTRKRFEVHSPYRYREKMHLQQKALRRQYFFIPNVCVLSHDCNPGAWFFLKFLLLYDLYTTFYLWHNVFFFPIGCWMLYCTVCRTILMKLQCLTWIIPLPYWEVFCVYCNVCDVVIVLWPIGVVAQNKA